MPANPGLALVPTKLFRNWAKKWNRFLNINNTLLNLKLLVKHSYAKIDKNLVSYIWAGLAIALNFTLGKATSRFLVFKTPSSYKLYVAKILEHTFYSSYVSIRKKRLIQRQKLEQKNIWSQIYWDEYHEEKSVVRIKMDICRNAKLKNNRCQI